MNKIWRQKIKATCSVVVTKNFVEELKELATLGAMNFGESGTEIWKSKKEYDPGETLKKKVPNVFTCPPKVGISFMFSKLLP